MAIPGDSRDLTAWIFVFDFDAESDQTPSPMRFQKTIQTSAAALAHHAIIEAPRGAIQRLESGIYPALESRLRAYWPLTLKAPMHRGSGGGVSVSEDLRPLDEIVADQTD